MDDEVSAQMDYIPLICQLPVQLYLISSSRHTAAICGDFTSGKCVKKARGPYTVLAPTNAALMRF